MPNQTNLNKEHALYAAAGTILCSFLPVIVFHPFFLYVLSIGQRIRIACCSLLYQKVLKCQKSHVDERLDVKVINLMSREINKLDYAIATCHELYRAPLEAVLIGIYIFKEVGFEGIFGKILMLAFVPLLFYIVRKTSVYRSRAAHHTEKRVHLMSEIIKKIENIKTFCMEQLYAMMIKDKRNKEIEMVRGSLYLRATSISLNFILKLSIFVCIVSVLNMNGYLTTSKVYVIILYYNMLFTSMLQFWPFLATHAREAYKAVIKIQNLLVDSSFNKEILIENEIKEKSSKNSNITDTLLMSANINEKVKRTVNENSEIKSISINNITFSKDNLKCDCIEINEAKCYAIIENLTSSSSSSSSSSFLKLLLGEMEQDYGEIEINGSMSCVSKDMWIFPGSVRENITFTEKFVADRYATVLKIAQIDKEIELLPIGDDTFIDELSANELFKLKINIARCIYRDADIYLFDKCFEDLMNEVSYKDILKKFLKDKIILIATQSWNLLKEADNIIGINENKVHLIGSLRDFRSTNLFEQLIPKSDVQDTEENSIKIFQRSNSTESRQSIIEKSSTHKNSLVAHQIPLTEYSENHARENVEWKSYRNYMKSLSSSKCGFTWFLILLFLAQLHTSGLELFIAKWFNHEESKQFRHVLSVNFTGILSINNSSRENEAFATNYDNWVNFIYFYSIILCTLLYFTVHRSFLFFKLCLRASINIHDKLFCGVTRATLRFFKCSSIQHILSFFTTDIETMDTQLPINLYDSILFFCETIGICTLIALTNYWLLLPTFIMLFAVFTLRYFYIDTARSLRGIESLTHNSIYSRITSTFQGLSTIRSTNSEKVLMDGFHKNMDLNTSATYLSFATARAFALWLDIICSIYIAIIILSFVVFENREFKSGDVGMAITQALHLLFFLQWGIRQTVEVGNQMTSVERIFEYQHINMEASLRTSNKFRPSKTWPLIGKVVFTNFHLRYSSNGFDVLKDLNFKINGGEKFGIVGPKNSGKSSIVQALQRFAINEGSIEIDDINIDTLGLHDLRRSFGVIPSNPILFSGTIRCNLDPFQQHTDEEIWNALECVDMKRKILKFEGALSTPADENMFNVKQMQLLYLARAHLAKTKILILDETTDKLQITDENEIQDVIRRNFYGCTIIAIAHRLNTIMDCDNIIVLEEGRIVEIGHPYELIQISRGFFRALVDKTGYINAMNLIKTSEKCYFAKRQRPLI
ncbi:probable multidrug resistance-associated protein lethal(2)03659 isoform X2 [Chironomus tepperi]